MSLKRSIKLLLLLLSSSFILAGCNTFEPFDTGLTNKNHEDKIHEANLALDSGKFAEALELFELVSNEGTNSDEVIRGKANSKAGLAGFSLLQAMNLIQNSTGPADNSSAVFRASQIITDTEKAIEATKEMKTLASPTKQDKLGRSFLVALLATQKLLQKYDTNLNKRLDSNDKISFTTNDNKTDKWSALYSNLSAESLSLEQSFLDMAQAFDNRGEQWTLVSPINGILYKGNFTPANRSAILAVGDMAEKLQLIDAYFDKSESLFKQTIISLDGAN